MKNNYEKAIDRLDQTAPDYWKRRMFLQIKSLKYEKSRTKMCEYDIKSDLFSIIEEAIENNIKTNFVEIKTPDVLTTPNRRGLRSRNIIYDDLCTIDADILQHEL